MGRKICSIDNLKKTVRYLQKNGIKHTYYAAKERAEEEKRTTYCYEKPQTEVLMAQKAGWHKFSYRFSIIVPAYETKKEFLRELIDSVRNQTYERWELIIADASKSDQVEEIVTLYQEQEAERRIRYLRLPENRGIAENTNAGIEIAGGDYIGLLDHDDLLAPDALYEMASAIDKAKKEGRTPVLLYSDEDKFQERKLQKIKPQERKIQAEKKYQYLLLNKKYKFNLDLILSNNYICHFMVVSSEYMKILRLRKKYDGAQDYDFVLRLIDRLLTTVETPALQEKIIHIPKVLYHWRIHEASTAGNTASKAYAYEAGAAALEDFCKRRGWDTKVAHSLHLGFYQMTYIPDIFSVRQDVGIVGGRIINEKNKVVSGIYDDNGHRLYQGLHKEYSGGSTHRAVLMQDCAAVDIRCMRIRKELQPVFKRITGVLYRESGAEGLADISSISCDEAGYRKLSMELGMAAAQMGYLVLWNPEITIKLKGDLIS